MYPQTAIITGANGGIGRVITEAVAKAGFHVIMACRNVATATAICEDIKAKSNNPQIEVHPLDLSSLASVRAFTDTIIAEKRSVGLLINNAGILSPAERTTADGLSTIVSVNYVAPYLLTRRLLPLMPAGGRIVNTLSMTYRMGRIPTHFFDKGTDGRYRRLSVYSNTKLALLLFTRELAKRTQDKGITVNAADPGIVDTDIITMHAWFDPLANLFFRPFIKTPAQGAATIIRAALSDKATDKIKSPTHPAQEKLWNDTEKLLVRQWLTIP